MFSDNGEKSNIILVHKKGNKKLLQNYRPVLLLPISSKIFERLIFNSLYKIVEINSLPWFECVNQLLSIVYAI